MPRAKRGGGIFHPYLAADSPNMIQTMDHKWNGSLDPVPKPASPVEHTWEFKSGTTQAVAGMYGNISTMAPIPYIYSRGGRRKTYRKRNTRRKSHKNRKSYRK